MKLNYNEKELASTSTGLPRLNKADTDPLRSRRRMDSQLSDKRKLFLPLYQNFPGTEPPSVTLPTVLPLKQQKHPANVSFTNVMPV